jgi:hypothetical protein
VPGDQPPADVIAWANALDLSQLTAEDEIRLGEELNRLIMAHVQPISGPLRQRALDVARNLSDAKYRITVLDTDAVNAFSHPGGQIYVCRGLLEFIGPDEDYALEFVLGHELAHLELQHALKCVRQASARVKVPIDTLNQFLIPIIVGYPDELEFEADDWIVKRMLTKLDRTRRETLAFLRKFQDYAERNGFAEGHTLPKRGEVFTLAEIHFRALPAASERLQRLLAAFKKTGPK